MRFSKIAMAAALGTLTLVGASAQAQTANVATAQHARTGDRADALLNPAVQVAPPPAINDGEAYHRADDAQQDPAELRTTQALNDEITSRNALARAQEQADQAAFEAARAKHEAVVAQATADQLAYEETVRQADAAQRRWQADRARWEVDVRACEAGDRTRCAGPR